VYGRVPLRHRHPFQIGFIGVAAYQSCLSRQCQLRVAFSQGVLRLLTLGNVACQPLDAQEPPRGVKLAPCSLLQPCLLAVRTDIAKTQGIRRVVRAESAYMLLKSRAIVGMHAVEEIGARRTACPILSGPKNVGGILAALR